MKLILSYSVTQNDHYELRGIYLDQLGPMSLLLTLNKYNKARTENYINQLKTNIPFRFFFFLTFSWILLKTGQTHLKNLPHDLYIMFAIFQ